ncbi:MAG: diguanylate cyclase [Nitrosomonadales bacterium]|nr:diguanylate cyclase [Nitrosomonadales bacterium]
MGLTGDSKFEEFKASGHLPSPKGVVLQVVRLTQRDDVSNHQFAQVIKADPALTGRLIKAANALVGHQTRPIVSVMDSLIVLGMNAVRQLALGFSLVADNRAGICKGFDYEGFWSHSLLMAIAAQHLIRHKGVAAPEEIFILGLLSQVGRLALATIYPLEYAVILEKAGHRSSAELVELERAAFDFDHNELSQAMLADWGMPRPFQQIAGYHENPEQADVEEGGRDWKLLNAMHIAGNFADICLASEPVRRKLVPRLMLLAARWGVESDMLIELGDNVIREWKDWGRLLELRMIELPAFAELLKTAPLASDMVEMPALVSGVGQFYRLRILLVDDDRSVLLLLKTMLTSAGHTVFTARNGNEALRMVAECSPQLIISDWIMPEMDGIAFCKALRLNPAWRNIYVFIVTAQESTERLVEAFEAGVDDYLVKPINSKVLGARLRAGQRVVQLQEELEQDREQLRKFAAELATSNSRLQQLALTDPLTGLPNRRYATDRLEQEWALSQRVHRPLSCMMIDIDYFKSINDTYGHKVGDDALKQMVQVLRTSARKQDVVSRLGGEEFMVICPDTTLDQARQHAERLRLNVAALKVQSGRHVFHLTVSIGVASNNSPELLSADMLLQLSDRHLYAAKSAGRNRIAFE